MKYFSILIISIILSSCSGTKKAIETQPEQTKNIADVSETLEDIEAQESENDNAETQEAGEILNNIGNTIAGVGSNEEAKEFLKKKVIQDSAIYVNQGYFNTNHSGWNELLQKHVSVNGNVDYGGFKKDKRNLNDYINSLTETKVLEKWSKEDTLAYWINAYNALTIDLIIRNYPLKTIKDIKDPWDQRLWKFGDKWLNLNDIEHKILRKMNEPRIHFAIVCASESCPKLQNEAFISKNLEEQLANATKEFLSDKSKNELSKNNIKLSKIFKWFAKDFKQDGTLIDFLNQYSEVAISNKAKKSYKDYDWNLNE